MNKKIKRILILSLILIIGFLAMLSTTSAANTWNINDNASSSNIQTIIDHVTVDGDTINFANGTYNNISLNISKSLNIQGNGATFNGRTDGSVVLSVTADNVIINNFTLNSGSTITTNHFNSVSNLNITNNIININKLTLNYHAIFLNNVHGAYVAGNIINGNGVIQNGIVLVNSSDITIQGNDIHDFVSNGITMDVWWGSFESTGTFNILIQENNIFHIGENGIFFGGGVSHVEIIANDFTTIFANAINIARSSTDILIENNIITDCDIGIRIEENNRFHMGIPTQLNNVTIKDNDIWGNWDGVFLVKLNNPTVWASDLNFNNTIINNIFF